MAFELGQRIEDYEFLDVLRSTRTAVDYRVRNHAAAGRLEALRVMPGDLRNDQERLERFYREIKIHGSLNHPNILGFYDAFILEKQLVMTTELADGVTLAERLDLGAIPWREAAQVAASVLAALEHAHGVGVVHREVIPANILLTSEGTVKLAGFGLARAMADPRLTQTGTLIGTLDYMSPEQVRGEDAVDGRSDLYSLGAVLYRMVTGERLFGAQSQFEVMMAHVNTPPPQPELLVPDLPQSMNGIILRALAKRPEDRFTNAQSFQWALHQALDGQSPVTAAALPARPRPVNGVPATAGATQAVWPQASDRRALYLVGGLLGVLGLFLAAAALR